MNTKFLTIEKKGLPRKLLVFALVTGLFLLFSWLCCNPTSTLAATDPPTTYNPIVGIPGVDGSGNAGFNDLINALYALSISIAALLAVVKIIVAGVKWMTSDIVTSREQAKKDISGSLFGLVIVLAAVLILTVINEDIVNVDLTFQDVESGFIGGGGNLTPPTDYPTPTETEAYSYLDFSAGSDAITAFLVDCTDGGGTPHVINSTARCVKANPETQTYDYVQSCDNINSCTDQRNEVENECVAKNGELYADTLRDTPPDEWKYCIYLP